MAAVATGLVIFALSTVAGAFFDPAVFLVGEDPAPGFFASAIEGAFDAIDCATCASAAMAGLFPRSDSRSSAGSNSLGEGVVEPDTSVTVTPASNSSKV
jgi:hypothetical protein